MNGRGRRSSHNDDSSNEVRVTDRRRVSLNSDSTEQLNPEVETTNLKPTYVEELEARTKAAESKVHEIQGRFDELRQQLQREADETRQRLNRAADERSTGEKARFITSLLPVIDDLNRAIEAADTSNASRDSILNGIRGIAASFQNALTAAGVETLNSLGEPFNPELHEAVDTGETEPEHDGMIIGEYSRGFRIGDRLLRPARVKVGRSAQAKNAAE